MDPTTTEPHSTGVSTTHSISSSSTVDPTTSTEPHTTGVFATHSISSSSTVDPTTTTTPPSPETSNPTISPTILPTEAPEITEGTKYNHLITITIGVVVGSLFFVVFGVALYHHVRKTKGYEAEQGVLCLKVLCTNFFI